MAIAATTAVTAAAASNKPQPVQLSEFEEQLLCGIYSNDGATEEDIAKRDSNWAAAKLLKEDVVDSLSLDNKTAGADGYTDADREIENILSGKAVKEYAPEEKYKAELDKILAAQSPDPEVILKKVESVTKYTMWSGRFLVNDVSKFSASFDEPAYFNVDIDKKKITVTSANNYENMYKSVSAYGKYQYNGETKLIKSLKDGTAEEYTTEVPSSSGELVEAAFYVYFHDGTGSGSPYKEVAVIHVVDKAYANSVSYAENSYANMLDQYTYVDN